MGGHVIEGFGAGAIVDTFLLDCDVYIRKVDYSYTKTSTNHLDALLLKTVDATAKTIVASQDPSADIVGVTQTLHADVAGDVAILQGDKIQATADGAGTTEGGIWFVTVWLEPVR